MKFKNLGGAYLFNPMVYRRDPFHGDPPPRHPRSRPRRCPWDRRSRHGRHRRPAPPGAPPPARRVSDPRRATSTSSGPAASPRRSETRRNASGARPRRESRKPIRNVRPQLADGRSRSPNPRPRAPTAVAARASSAAYPYLVTDQGHNPRSPGAGHTF